MTDHFIRCLDSLTHYIPPCAAVITDPPYSGRTHDGHDQTKNVGRTPIGYTRWTAEDVEKAVNLWSPLCMGWMVIITDHVLASIWETCMRLQGRYVFAPVPAVAPGSRVRLRGDGPSCWTWWVIVGRPKCKPYSTWGTLPGAYIGKPEKMPITGGKPEWLMKALVRDYSREGELIVDPCAGAGTTLRAAKDLGRRAIGFDIDPKVCAIAQKRLAQEVLLV